MRIALFMALGAAACGFGADQHLLYVANPGTRNYVEYGGVDLGLRRVERIQVCAGFLPGK